MRQHTASSSASPASAARSAAVVALLLHLNLFDLNAAFAPGNLHVVLKQHQQPRHGLLQRLEVAVPASDNPSETLLSKLALLEKVRREASISVDPFILL